MELPQPTPPHPESLYQSAPGGLACTSEDGTFLAANETLCSWLGRPAEALVGKIKLQALLTMGGRIFHQTHWAPLLRMQGSVSEVKLEVLHADGHIIPMVMNAVRRETSSGVIHEVLMIVARDRDAYERELVLSRKKLQSMVEETAQLHAAAKDRALFAEQMVGIVSHDLRNPLSTIQMGATILSRGGTNQEAVLGRVSRAADRALRLVSDLLDFTQARLGQGLGVSLTQMNLRECVAEAVEELSLAYPAHTIIHQHSGEMTCSADGDRLSQLVGNLVANAATYGLPDGYIYVRSSIESSLARLSVQNEGEPIAQSALETLFSPMVRGEVDTVNRSAGLGLYIVREIAKAHGGDVTVTSNARDGTCFEASFPI